MYQPPPVSHSLTYSFIYFWKGLSWLFFHFSTVETSEDVHPQQLCGSNREEAICTKMGDPKWFSTWHYPNKNFLSLTWRKFHWCLIFLYMLNAIIYSYDIEFFYSIELVKMRQLDHCFYEINILILKVNVAVFMAGLCKGVWRDTGECNAHHAKEASFQEILQLPEWEPDSHVSTCCGRLNL